MADVKTNRLLEVELVKGPLQVSAVPAIDGAGAVLSFAGVVRPTEDGQSIIALDYTTYDPMAEQELCRIVTEAADARGLLWVRLIHSSGRVPVGEASLRLWVAAAHRKPAIQAMDQIIDALKRDVPIWKTAVFDSDR